LSSRCWQELNLTSFATSRVQTHSSPAPRGAEETWRVFKMLARPLHTKSIT
jgi:hypothetical protein